MSPKQIGYVRGLLAKAGMPEEADKEELALIHSSGRTKSLTAMTYDETQSAIAYLQGVLRIPPSPAEKMRNKIISIGHEMKWHQHGTRKIDMFRVDGWCLDKFHSTLDDLPYLDLCRAVTAFEQVLVGYLKGI